MSTQKSLYQPNPEFAANARIKNMDMYWKLQNKAIEDYEGFWKECADEKIDWLAPYEKVLDESNAPFYEWFTNGKLNVSNQCIDRHLADKAHKTAILFEGDRGEEVSSMGEKLYSVLSFFPGGGSGRNSRQTYAHRHGGGRPHQAAQARRDGKTPRQPGSQGKQISR